MPAHTVSVITTVYNEAETIGELLESLASQSREPDEIVICDAGSEDGTADVVRRWIADGLSARLIVAPGASRSRGRNLAIRAATGEIIAGIDAGCTAKRDWLEKLGAPFDEEHPPDVVCGYYEPDTASPLEDAIAVATVPDASEVNPETFLPSGRSVAFRRAAWERVGGYPEYIEYAEDTEFGKRLRRRGFRFVFLPEAMVRWRMRSDLIGVFRQFFGYARSDGELGHWFLHYGKSFAELSAAAALIALAAAGLDTAGALLALLLVAYWVRYTVRARRRGAEWLAAILSPGVSITVDLANALGYARGFLRRRPRPAVLSRGRLSVAQVTYTYQPVAGGADVYVSQLAELITAAGHEHVVYQRAEITAVSGVRFVPNPWRGLPLEFWTQALALFRLRKQLLAHDVVICHYPHYLLALDLMSFFGRRPVRVGVSHGVFWDDAPGSLRSLLKGLLTRIAFRRAHLYVANDTHFLRAMRVAINPRERMHEMAAPVVWFIPNGVDIEKFRPREPVTEVADRHPILVPRNLFRNRGIHLAIEAFAQFHPRHPDTALFIVGGGGQAKYAAELEEQVEARGLRQSVVFYGAAAHEELPAIYSSAQLTLIPSLCGEGTSLSALESMGCGTATICTYVAGLRDLPGPHALPIVASLVEVMESVWPERRRVGEEQRKIVVSAYPLSRWWESWSLALRGVGVSPHVGQGLAPARPGP